MYSIQQSSKSKSRIFRNKLFKFHGRFQTSKKELKDQIKSDGGKIFKKETIIDYTSAIIVGEESRHTVKPNFILNAEASNIDIVNESWLLACFWQRKFINVDKYKIQADFWKQKKRKKPDNGYNKTNSQAKRGRYTKSYVYFKKPFKKFIFLEILLLI